MIWMLCNKLCYRIVYHEPHMSLKQLLNRHQTVSIHCKHLNTLLTKTLKHFQGEILILRKAFSRKKM